MRPSGANRTKYSFFVSIVDLELNPSHPHAIDIFQMSGKIYSTLLWLQRLHTLGLMTDLELEPIEAVNEDLPADACMSDGELAEGMPRCSHREWAAIDERAPLVLGTEMLCLFDIVCTETSLRRRQGHHD